MKTLDQLKKGETLLTTIRKVEGGKYQIEIAELIENPSAKLNIAALLNKGDDRFNTGVPKPRRAWQSATPEGLKEFFNIDVNKLKFVESDGVLLAEVNMPNPTIQGDRLHVLLKDSFTKSYEKQKPKLSIRKGKDGVESVFVFMKDGKEIYQSTQIVAGEAKHTIIESDERKEYKAEEEVLSVVDSREAINGK